MKMNLAGMFYGVLNKVLAGKGHCGVRDVRDVVSSAKSKHLKTQFIQFCYCKNEM